MIGWAARLRVLAAERPVALVTILATEGSAPRGAGTRMLVTAAGSEATIGGGQLEYRAIEQARAVLALPPGSWRVQDYPLGPLLGQCCGGRVRLLVEHVDPARLGWTAEASDGAVLVTTYGGDGIGRRIDAAATPTPLGARGQRPLPGDVTVERLGEPARPLYLFGAGHVGRAIAAHARGLPFRLAWFDTRTDVADVDGVTVVAEAEIERCVSDAPVDAALLILTHDHGLDYALTRAALGRGPLAFTGLIGSATKRARFLARLERDGLGEAARARLVSPIGLPGVAGKEPDVIAVSALAQLLQLGRQ